MKTFQRINLIGILCISFGVYALLSKGMLMIMFARHQMGAGVTPQQPVWMMVSPTFELLVDMVYLVAGIFFLKKKSFSLMLMYTALILSLLSNFVPVIILGFQQAKIPWPLLNIFFLIGPMIDLYFLVSVYRIRKYYYTDPEKEVHLLNLGNLSQTGIKWISIGGFLLMLIPLSLFILWFAISRMDIDIPEKINVYHQYLPAILEPEYVPQYLSLFCCFPAIAFSSIGLRLDGKGWRWLNKVTMIISILMFMVNMWFLM